MNRAAIFVLGALFGVVAMGARGLTWPSVEMLEPVFTRCSGGIPLSIAHILPEECTTEPVSKWQFFIASPQIIPPDDFPVSLANVDARTIPAFLGWP